jgi:hypothetical protein
MQKVVGSNPISRFPEIPPVMRDLVFAPIRPTFSG